MKKYIKILFVILISIPITAIFAQSSDIGKLETCLAHSSATAAEQSRNAITCYNLALPFYGSNAVLESALYSRALEQYLTNSFYPSGGNRSSYNAIALALSDYFKRFLAKKLTEVSLKQMSARELQVLFEAVSGVTFYSLTVIPNLTSLQKEYLVFRELESRKLATEEQAAQIIREYLGASDNSKAQELLKRWPSVLKETLPSTVEDITVGDKDLGYFTLSKDLKTMTLQRLNLDKGSFIVMFGDCHFAQQAIEMLGAYSDISEVMRRFGIEIGSPDETEFGKIDSLRKQFPSFEIHPAYKQAIWFQKGIEVFEMPSFAFFQDGVVKYRIHGVDDFLVQEFCIGLESIGVSRPPSCKS